MDGEMKIRLEQIAEGNDEVILRYREMTPQITALLHYLDRTGTMLVGKRDGQQVVLHPRDVIYLESVDGITYLYTPDEVYSSGESLTAAQEKYSEEGYFRCSKSMVMNIYHIDRLQSLSGNRIDAEMSNGEHVIISRHYAKELRRILKGGKG